MRANHPETASNWLRPESRDITVLLVFQSVGQ